MRKIPQVDRRMRIESWPPIPGWTLEGKTVGVFGFGRIGKEVARVMKILNTRVLGYSRTLTPERAAEVGAECVGMETLMRAAMIRALESGKLGGVGLDVFDVEPLPMDHPLRRFDNAVLLSHRGYATVEVLSERYEQAMMNILDYLDDRPMKLLNPEVLPK